MIAFLRGPVVEKSPERVVVDAGGVGYEVCVNPSTCARLPEPGGTARLAIAESVALYGGGTTLYGFLTGEEREVFLSVKEHVPNTGARKALEVLERASRSLPDFIRAVESEDARSLSTVFGFTPKTAQKLLSGLRGRLGALPCAGAGGLPQARDQDGTLARAMEALSAMGYRPAESGPAVEAVLRELGGREAGVEEVLRMALKRL